MQKHLTSEQAKSFQIVIFKVYLVFRLAFLRLWSRAPSETFALVLRRLCIREEAAVGKSLAPLNFDCSKGETVVTGSALFSLLWLITNPDILVVVVFGCHFATIENFQWFSEAPSPLNGMVRGNH